MTRVYVIFGQGGFLTSLGMVALAGQIRAKFGAAVIVTEHQWWKQQEIVDGIRSQSRGTKIVIVGYSLGANAIPPIAAALERIDYVIDLAIAYDPSIWSPSSRYIPWNVSRCIVYHGTGWSLLGHALFTGKTVVTRNVFDMHEVMDFDQTLHNWTLGYINEIMAG